MEKGVSPLVAMITLIGCTLIVAAAVINWGVVFVQRGTYDLSKCSKGQITLRKAYYDENEGVINFLVQNTGKIPLIGFSIIASYPNGTTFSSDEYRSYGLGVDAFIEFEIKADYLKDVIIQSRECKNVKVIASEYDIEFP
jgi:preprotein translocase subunit SecY